ncbi:hypothetical protein BN159_6629 [Streptomyces davaonensis JCM 4913]|uniref:Uncharacterized protein n=1 Tax=Streptomyces davaonensis (strain DSM 101723 / JCM 4913 / KCC S-0913 / 768) TaxID=1214101 RepID=K4RBV4_STRDJ|nr:hypothetical protein [Streptomyces davaonensis]CCK31008.1 hypothetical protein BN159_6629 [Streptomyces davaonensis JCM 4913]
MTMQRDVHDELRARLHEAAEAHEPNRERILARIERGMSEQAGPDHRATRPPVFGWVRVVSATAAVAGVLAIGGYAVASAVKEDTPQQTVATTPTPTPSPDATSRTPAPPAPPADPTPESSEKSREPSSPPATAPPTQSVKPPAAGAEDGPLWSDGSVDPHSNDFWAQSNVTLKTEQQLTELTVELKVAQTGGVTSTGAWRSLPEDDFELTVGERDGFLVYTWVLKEGRTVGAGEWVFAGQYDHERGGRDAQADGYAATARAGDEELSVAGDFAPRKGDDAAAEGDS